MSKKIEIFLIVLGSLVVAYLIYVFATPLVFENRFGFNAKMAGVDVSLKTKKEALDLLRDRTDDYLKGNILIDGKSYPVSDFVTIYNLSDNIKEALDKQNKEVATLSVFRHNSYDLNSNFQQKQFGALLRAQYDAFSVIPRDAHVDIESESVIRGAEGQRLLLAESRDRIQRDLAKLNPRSGFVIDRLEPMVTDVEAAAFVEEAKKSVAEPIQLTSEQGNFEVKPEELVTWLKVMPKTPRTIVAVEPLVDLTKKEFFYFDANKVTDYANKIKGRVDQPKKNASLQMANGVIHVQTAEKIGYSLDLADTVQKIQDAATGNRSIELAVNTDLPDVRSDNLDELGITELISTGTTDFRGSPANRIHNFNVGASKFNGVLIKPDERFSFNNTLGPVEASTGYLPELVILENKTTPQYGGGLCQVSSTAFRAALNAGLPILERRYHAYPVSYYKPYGVDATIYLPKPDLVFKNDTGHYILIQTHINGTKLYFDFYGTKAARSVKFAGNIKGDGAVFLVESVNPGIYDAGLRGKGSFTASVYRFIYDINGKHIRTDTFISKYDSPEKYPH